VQPVVVVGVSSSSSTPHSLREVLCVLALHLQPCGAALSDLVERGVRSAHRDDVYIFHFWQHRSL
jgi:hypothetical protein